MSVLILIMNVLGAVSLFLYGMKVMSEGVQRLAGGQLQDFLNRMTKNAYSGAFAGTIFTTALQSSSIVSVLTLSFVNAGFLNLRRAFSVIVGANVGTTLKLWLIVLLGFFWHIENLALPIIATTALVYFFSNQKAKNWVNFFMAMAFIFLGFYFLKLFLPDLTQFPFFHQFIENYNGKTTLFSSLILVLMGVFITFLFHSSSAFTLLVAVLVAKGLEPEQAAMMIIGANIGTTSTALIASSVGNKASKIVAWFHFMFNCFGGVLFFFFVPTLIYLIQSLISTDSEVVLISFHTLFNLGSALLILPFLNKITDWVEARYLNQSEDESSLKLIGMAYGPTAKMYVYEANREVVKFASIVRQIVNNLDRMISEGNEDKIDELRRRIITLEKEADELESKIINYLNSIYQFEMPGDVAINIHQLIEVSHHLENIGNLALRIANTHKDRRKSNSFITPKLRNLLLEFQEVLSFETTTLVQNLNDSQYAMDNQQFKQFEKLLNKKFSKAELALLKAVESEKLSIRSALFYSELIHSYMRIGDHLNQANKALRK